MRNGEVVGKLIKFLRERGSNPKQTAFANTLEISSQQLKNCENHTELAAADTVAKCLVALRRNFDDYEFRIQVARFERELRQIHNSANISVVDCLDGLLSQVETREHHNELKQLVNELRYTPAKFWNFPRRPSVHYQRDADDLQLLSENLSLTSSAVIAGLRGIGKTELTLNYVWENEKLYEILLWIRGGSAEEILVDVRGACQRIGASTIGTSCTDVFRGWMSNSSKYLVVVDGVTQLEAVKSSIPLDFRGHVIITSHNSHESFSSILGTRKPMKLKPMTDKKALAFLLQRTNRNELSSTENTAVHGLIKEFAGLPLAIEQAGAFINRTALRFSDYLALYRSEPGKTLGRSFTENYPHSVKRTFELSLHEIGSVSPITVDTLLVAACFANEGIPLTLLRAGTSKETNALVPVFLTFRDDPFSLNEILEVAARYSIIDLDPIKQSLTMHPVVQHVIRQYSERHHKLAAVALLNQVLLGGIEIALLPHITNVLDLVTTLGEMSSMEIAQELSLRKVFGIMLMAARGYGADAFKGNSARARQLCKKIRDWQTTFHFECFEWQSTLVRGELRTALAIARRLRRVVSGKPNSKILLLEALRAEGESLFYLGRLTEAKAVFDHALSLYQPKEDSRAAFTAGQDPGVACLCHRALIQWMFGYHEESLKDSELALRHSQFIDYPLGEAFALLFAGALRQLRREPREGRQVGMRLLSLCKKQPEGIPVWEGLAGVLIGAGLVADRVVAEGIAQMQDGIALFKRTNSRVAIGFWSAIYAEAISREAARLCKTPDEIVLRGKLVDDGLLAISDALTLIEDTGEQFWESELQRVNGELLLLMGESSRAVKSLSTAIKLSKAKGAKALEFRSVVSMCKLLHFKGEKAEAGELLLNVMRTHGKLVSRVDFEEAKSLQ